MAKIAFSKLGVKLNNQIATITFNNQTIEIKQYLPLKEKMDIVNNIVEKAISINPNYYNPAEIAIAENLEIILHYTNISFTEKQMVDTLSLYDILVSSGLSQAIIEAINKDELNNLHSLMIESLSNYYSYVNSIGGVLQTAAQSTENMKQLKELVESNDLSFLKDIVGQLG